MQSGFRNVRECERLASARFEERGQEEGESGEKDCRVQIWK